MTATVPGARFQQLQPVQANAFGGLDGTAAPYTVFTVPAGKTYRLWSTSVSAVLATAAAYAGGFAGQFVAVRDTLGNTYAECEVFVSGPGQACPNQGQADGQGVQLPAGTTVFIAVVGAPLTATLAMRAGGGAVWSPS